MTLENLMLQTTIITPRSDLIGLYKREGIENYTREQGYIFCLLLTSLRKDRVRKEIDHSFYLSMACLTTLSVEQTMQLRMLIRLRNVDLEGL